MPLDWGELDAIGSASAAPIISLWPTLADGSMAWAAIRGRRSIQQSNSCRQREAAFRAGPCKMEMCDRWRR
jgi:hypothetical protein